MDDQDAEELEAVGLARSYFAQADEVMALLAKLGQPGSDTDAIVARVAG